MRDARCQPELVDDQLSRVEHTRRLREELVFRLAIGFEIGLV
jgi:hypothetical protein